MEKVKGASNKSEAPFPSLCLPPPPGTSLKVFSWAGVKQPWPWETGQGAGASAHSIPACSGCVAKSFKDRKTQLEPQGSLFQEARHFPKLPIIGEVLNILRARTTLQKHEPGRQSEDNRVHPCSPNQSQVRSLVLSVMSNLLTPWGFLLLGALVITQALNVWWINEKNLFFPAGSGCQS